MRLSLITGPSTEPLSRAEAKKHLVVPDTFLDDDALIDALIVAARQRAELETNRALITQVWEAKCDAFPAMVIEVPRPPLVTVDSLTYVDPAGNVQTLAANKYQVDAPTGPYAARGRVAPVYGEVFPQTRPETLNAVILQFTAGYGNAAAVPQAIKQAMLLMIGEWYQPNRQNVEVGAGLQIQTYPLSAHNLLVPFKSRPVQH